MKLATSMRLIQYYCINSNSFPYRPRPSLNTYSRLVKLLSGYAGTPEIPEFPALTADEYDLEIPLEKILTHRGLEAAVWALRAVPGAERDSRMLTVWCARQLDAIKNGTAKRSINMVDTAERYANWQATELELHDARLIVTMDFHANSKDDDAAPHVAWNTGTINGRLAAWDILGDMTVGGIYPTVHKNLVNVFQQMCCGEAPWQQDEAERKLPLTWDNKLTEQRFVAWFRRLQKEDMYIGYSHAEMQKLLDLVLDYSKGNNGILQHCGPGLTDAVVTQWRDKAANEESITDMERNQLLALLNFGIDILSEFETTNAV